MEETLKEYREDSMKHHGGGGGEWSVTPGDFWSRGAEPSLLVVLFCDKGPIVARLNSDVGIPFMTIGDPIN